jgi:hypothetical protein
VQQLLSWSHGLAQPRYRTHRECQGPRIPTPCLLRVTPC